MHAGGGAYTDSGGKLWAADTSYNGGATYAVAGAIAGTSDSPLYQAVRYGDFSYQFAVPNGSYTVNLKFAEVYWSSPGQRVFDVLVEGQPALSNFDIVAQAGGSYTALDKSVTTTVSDGTLTVQFLTRVDNAMVSGLEITASGTSAASPTPTLSPSAPPPGALQAMINAAAPGGIVSVPPGIYREQVTITKPLTLAAQPGAEIRGSDVWSDWAPSGTRWVSLRTVPSFPAVGADRCDGGRCAWPEQVFLDGVELLQVATGTVPASGQFALDGSRHVLLADNPTGRVVEVTTRVRWIEGAASNVTIQGFTMQHAASGALDGGISLGATSTGWTVQDNHLLHTHGGVLWGGYGSGHRILRNEIAYGGVFGIIDTGADALVQGNDIHHNHTEFYNCGWGCGGLKMTQTGLVFDANTVHDNQGPGVWVDIQATGARFTNNRVHHNRDIGIFCEITSGCVITDNVVYNNGGPASGWGWGGGIVLSSSRDAEIARNVVAWNGDGITILSQDRPDAPAGQTANVFVHDNTIVQQNLDSSAYTMGWLNGWAGPMCSSTANNTGANNALWGPSGFSRVDWCGGMNLSQFQTTPGGAGSYLLTDTQKDQILSSRGIPTTP